MDELMIPIALKLGLFVLGTTLLVQVIKWLVKTWCLPETAEKIAKKAQTIALLIGIALAVGWKQSIFPANEDPRFELFAYALTGLIVGGASVGAFEFWKHYITKHE